MSKLPIVVLILLGFVWLLYAVPFRSANESAALSDASQMESDLMKWANRHVGKEAVNEIFDEPYSLKLGGESKKRNFHEMIRDIVGRSTVPAWPGLIAVVIGVFSLSKWHSSSASNPSKE